MSDQPQTPGYRYLEEGEIVREGDEYRLGSGSLGSWVPCHEAWKKVGKAGGSERRFRRPISQDPKDMAPLPPEMADLVTPMVPALVWGKEKPTVAGRYFISDDHTRESRFIAEITEYNGQLWVEVDPIEGISTALSEFCWFAGPISEPLEVGE